MNIFKKNGFLDEENKFLVIAKSLLTAVIEMIIKQENVDNIKITLKF